MLTDVQKKKLEEFCEVCGREDWAYVGPARKPDSCMIRFAWCSPKNAAEHWRLGYEHMKKAAVLARSATPAEPEKLGEVEALRAENARLRELVRREAGYLGRLDAARAENARLRELMEDVASHLYVEGVDTEGGWQCVECGRPQPELKSYAIHVDGCSVGAFETALGYTPEPPRSAPSAGPSTVATKGEK